MADEYKLTIIGKFLRTRPKIELIRTAFIEKVSTKGTVKIGAYDLNTIFIDFSNEADCSYNVAPYVVSGL